VSLPPPSPRTVTALRDVIPGFGSVGNPADLAGGPGGAQRFAGALRAFAADPGFGTVVVPLGPSMDGARERVIDASVVAETSPANVCVYWVNPWESGPAMEAILGTPGLSVFRSLRGCSPRSARGSGGAACVSTLPRWRHPSGPGTGIWWPPSITALRERISDGPGLSLTEHVSRTICAIAGIPLAPAEFVTDRAGAAQAAQRLGCTTVVKVVSPDLPHKSEAGGVRVGLSGPDEAAAAFDEVVANAEHHAPDARIEGALVSTMLTGVTELLIGARRDPVFGPARRAQLGRYRGGAARVAHRRAGPGGHRRRAGDAARAARLSQVDRLPGEAGRPMSNRWPPRSWRCPSSSPPTSGSPRSN